MMKVPISFKGLTHRAGHENAVIATEKNIMAGWGFMTIWRRNMVLAAALICVAPVDASAQVRNLTTAPQATAAAPLISGAGSPGATIANPAPFARPPPLPPVAQAAPIIPPGHVALAVAARYGHDSPPISGGLIWRVYTAKPDSTGVFHLLKEDRGAAPTFVLPPGNYVVHASIGLASAAKAIQLRTGAVHEVFDIPAGGVRVE